MPAETKDNIATLCPTDSIDLALEGLIYCLVYLVVRDVYYSYYDNPTCIYDPVILGLSLHTLVCK